MKKTIKATTLKELEAFLCKHPIITEDDYFEYWKMPFDLFDKYYPTYIGSIVNKELDRLGYKFIRYYQFKDDSKIRPNTSIVVKKSVIEIKPNRINKKR